MLTASQLVMVLSQSSKTETWYQISFSEIFSRPGYVRIGSTSLAANHCAKCANMCKMCSEVFFFHRAHFANNKSYNLEQRETYDLQG